MDYEQFNDRIFAWAEGTAPVEDQRNQWDERVSRLGNLSVDECLQEADELTYECVKLFENLLFTPEEKLGRTRVMDSAFDKSLHASVTTLSLVNVSDYFEIDSLFFHVVKYWDTRCRKAVAYELCVSDKIDFNPSETIYPTEDMNASRQDKLIGIYNLLSGDDVDATELAQVEAAYQTLMTVYSKAKIPLPESSE